MASSMCRAIRSAAASSAESDLVDVALGHTRAGVADQRFDGGKRIAKILSGRAEGMTQAVAGNPRHVLGRYFLEPSGQAGVMLGVVVMAGKTYFDLDLAAAAFTTAITADPTGRMLLPVLVSPRRSAMPAVSTSVLSSPSISSSRQPVNVARPAGQNPLPMMSGPPLLQRDICRAGDSPRHPCAIREFRPLDARCRCRDCPADSLH